jgi:predicted Zn finger-like uncharacterized protein
MIDTMHLVTCPSCSALFRMKREEVMLDGRIVRCTQCQTMWNLESDGTNGAIVSEEPQMESPPISAKIVQIPLVEVKKKQIPVVYVMLAFIFTAIIGFIAGRETMIRAFPQSVTLYQSFGFVVNELELSDVSGTRLFENDVDTLIIDGKMSNLTKEPKPTLPLRITLRDQAKKEVHSWVYTHTQSTIAAGETLKFQTRLEKPPVTGADIALQLLAKP